MLDDLKMSHERDGQDMLGLAEKQTGQLEHDLELVGALKPDGILNIVYGA